MKKEKLSDKKIKIVKHSEEWDKVIYHNEQVKKVKRKRINAKTPLPFKKAGPAKPGRRLNYKFKGPDD